MKEKSEVARIMNLGKGEHVDPVCGMRVEKKNSPGSSKFEGQKYYFCSVECKKEFEDDPSRFAISVIPKVVVQP
jgi:YHS domain-containing protein